MKITKIELKNFRAFYGEHTIDLSKKGKNLLIYGENGSGKSSLLKAIELFKVMKLFCVLTSLTLSFP
ncbi:AAA family ATPase [Nostoc sp. NMS4]|uniref:AAA family ATPase n=1 Tax=Nostoc sp. NMS4 TaxID=2815390 RepID=UPI0025E555EF|nr:AAA family ATPase [Nostoc sp. NMS4]MBN3923585.1 AAA family ATPase [Nostoc sp. NMS4]